MKILHISHGKLPDSRIEKVAKYFKDKGHELVFLGDKKSDYDKPIFDEVYQQTFQINRMLTVFNHLQRKQLNQRIDKIAPDLIHCHNIFSAMILYPTDIPMVYDDHEYWSQQVRLDPFGRGYASVPKMSFHAMFYPLYHWKIKQSEKEIIRMYPTITTNNRVFDIHQKNGAVFVRTAWNYPARWQIAGLDVRRHFRKGVVYAGGDAHTKNTVPHRNMTGLDKYIEYDRIGGLSHADMMYRLLYYKFGIVGWKYHPILRYKNQNKIYEYLHAGCQLIIPEWLAWQFPADLEFIHTFMHYKEIPEIIQDAHFIDPLEIAEYAREHYLWEKNIESYEQAYEVALSG